MYPFDSEEEYFFDNGQQMLSQRSGNVVGTATEWTVDDFIWLDGKPIVIARGSFSSKYTRNLDTQASCNRFGEPGVCGFYHLVHDYLPKPVLLMQASTGKIANVALYDDFGQPNRMPLIAGTGLPATTTMIADVRLPTSPSAQFSARVLYNYVDLPTGASVTVNGVAPLATQQTAQVWSAWTPSAATDLMQVRLNSTNCGAQCSRQGVQTDAIEYRRFESGVTPMWTTLRLPGQQFDEETDLFENWNRFLEPSLGRYLSPEPMLQYPQWVKDQAQSGFSTPTYAYARNNPARYIDQDGQWPWDTGAGSCRKRGFYNASGTGAKSDGTPTDCNCRLRTVDADRGTQECWGNTYSYSLHNNAEKHDSHDCAWNPARDAPATARSRRLRPMNRSKPVRASQALRSWILATER